MLLAATAEWMVQAWSERASADQAYNTEVRERIALPLEFPILAAVGVGVIIYSFSRVMLGLPVEGRAPSSRSRSSPRSCCSSAR